MRFPLLLLMCVSCAAGAQVYRSIGPDGQTIYSDRPLPNAEEVPVEPQGELELEPQATPDGGGSPPRTSGFTGPYELFDILAPQNEQQVRDANGEVPVSLVVAPSLRDGHGLVVQVDGIAAEGSTSNNPHMVLRGLTLGSHTLQAFIQGPDGDAVAATTLVNIHVLPPLPESAQFPTDTASPKPSSPREPLRP